MDWGGGVLAWWTLGSLLGEGALNCWNGAGGSRLRLGMPLIPNGSIADERRAVTSRQQAWP